MKNSKFRDAADRLAPGHVVRLSGLHGAATALGSGAIAQHRRAAALAVVPHGGDADDFADDLETLCGVACEVFCAWEVDIGTEHLNDEIIAERMRICNMLAHPPGGRNTFVAAPVMALLQPVPSPGDLAAARLEIRKSATLQIDELIKWLIEADFARSDQVYSPGEFARRGGIADIFPLGHDRPVRVEYFGDEVDSIRLFEPETQRSIGEIESCQITSAAAGGITAGASATIFDYLPPDAVMFLREPDELYALGEQLYTRTRHLGRSEEVRTMHKPKALFEATERFARAELYAEAGDDGHVEIGTLPAATFSTNVPEAMEELAELARSADAVVYCRTEAQKNRLGELYRRHMPGARAPKMQIGRLGEGFRWPGQRLAVVGHHEIFHRYTRPRRFRPGRGGAVNELEAMLDLRAGDYVVHTEHGIARFEGLRRIDKDGGTREFLCLRFAGNSMLNVPAERIDLVHKYIGAARRRPTLSRLGGKMWSKTTDRVGRAVRELAAEMLRTQAIRQSSRGVSYPTGTPWQRQFDAEFIYDETPDQSATMRQIDGDLGAPGPMDRLLCGDVGYGKTELAMRAAFRAAEAGKQTAVLVPTTVLAEQHWRTFAERFADYPVTVDMLSRFRNPAQARRIIKLLAEGKIDVIVGTHRLLSDDVRFADLGLVIIDEEQRFGVEHKERLKQVRATVDVLTMTATPIPRTLHMSLLGLRDISALATAPLDRRSIHTEVCHWDDDFIRRAIGREMGRRGQVFFVHNRVHDIHTLAERVGRLANDARIGVAHGRMSSGELERTMLRFVRREIDVLVCTTIIESGLDIPTANTMIIHEADRFGLAELHQLRGRVGRYKHRAYCYLLLPETRPVRPAASRRLRAVEEFSELGAGFKIAMRDLQLRGAGNILGAEQSGHIAAVGYEMYCRLLRGAVDEIHGRSPARRRRVRLDIGMETYVPPSYVPSDRQRMDIYRRAATAASVEDLEHLHADLLDTCGPPPPPVGAMLESAEIRLRAGTLGISGIMRSDPDVIFTVDNFSKVSQELLNDADGTVRIADEHTAHWRPPENYLEPTTLRRVLLNRLRSAMD